MANAIRNGTVVLGRTMYSLYVRLPIDPKSAESRDDKFILSSSEGYHQEKTIRDDQVAGDEFIDLLFTHMRADWKYSLKIDPGKEGDPYFIFKDVPYPKLAMQFGKAAVADEDLDAEADWSWPEDEFEEAEAPPAAGDHGGQGV